MILLVILLLLFPQFAWSAVSFDTTAQATADVVSTLGVTHVVGGGCTNPVLYVDIAWGDTTSVSITDASTTAGKLTLLASVNSASGFYTASTYKYVGATGSQDVSFTWDGNIYSAQIITTSFCGVDQFTSEHNVATNNSAGFALTLTVTSTTGELVKDMAFEHAYNEALTVDASQTERAQQGFTGGRMGVSTEAGAASVSMDWTQVNANYWDMIGFSIIPSAPPAVSSDVSRRRTF